MELKDGCMRVRSGREGGELAWVELKNGCVRTANDGHRAPAWQLQPWASYWQDLRPVRAVKPWMHGMYSALACSCDTTLHHHLALGCQGMARKPRGVRRGAPRRIGMPLNHGPTS